jgi:alpha-1,2-mannosyltransferase
MVRDARAAWICWIVFALAVVGVTLAKRDVIVLASGERVTAQIESETADAVVARVRRGGEWRSETFPRAGVAWVGYLGDRSVTPEYRRAAKLWWTPGPIYGEAGSKHGFLYLPQAAVLFTPFALLPASVGEPLWRVVSIGVYAWGVLALCRVASGGGVKLTPLFTLATVLAIPAAMGSAQNGQTNLIIGGLFALAAAGLVDRRWWSAAACLVVALAFKPVVLVLIGLAGVVYLRAMGWRLAVGMAVLAALPLVHHDPAWALAQYPGAMDKMLAAADPDDLFQDVGGLLAEFGVEPGEGVLLWVRAIAAPATLVLSLLAARRLTPVWAGLTLLGLGVSYIMLFNPRTEGVTYAMLGPIAAVFAGVEVVRRRWGIALVLVAFCVLLQFSRVVTGGANYWVRPLGTLVFAAYLCAGIARRERAGADPRLG